MGGTNQRLVIRKKHKTPARAARLKRPAVSFLSFMFMLSRWLLSAVFFSQNAVNILADLLNSFDRKQSEIIRFCIDLAKSEGYKAIRVDIVPDNYPAKMLFEKNGFDYAGDVDLELNIGNIPAFSLYELNW